jgi:hypothetical protein
MKAAPAQAIEPSGDGGLDDAGLGRSTHVPPGVSDPVTGLGKIGKSK